MCTASTCGSGAKSISIMLQDNTGNTTSAIVVFRDFTISQMAYHEPLTTSHDRQYPALLAGFLRISKVSLKIDERTSSQQQPLSCHELPLQWAMSAQCYKGNTSCLYCCSYKDTVREHMHADAI